MTKLCSNCGTKLSENEYFCSNCGAKREGTRTATLSSKEILKNQIGEIDFTKINRELKIKNSQKRAVTISFMIALITTFLVILTFVEGSPFYQWFALSLIGIFVIVSSLVVALVFRSRAKKLDTLISGENILAGWQLNQQQKADFVKFTFQNERTKNRALLGLTTLLIVIIFSVFILLIDEGKGAMFLVMLALIAIIAFFAFAMPAYYHAKNLKGDGLVMIGSNYAYVNGFFHNWDFPLSGIQKIKTIDQPFYGLFIQYYYYDRTLKHTEELTIPAPPDIDLDRLVSNLRMH